MDRDATPHTQEKLAVFCSYAHKDQPLFEELKTHLVPLVREGLMDFWDESAICAGEDREQQIQLHLDAADVIVLLVSPDFLACDSCYSIQMPRALTRQACGKARVVPIILRPVSWKSTPIGGLQALPDGALPITSRQWHSQDEAFYTVVEGIRDVLQTIACQRSLSITAPASQIQDAGQAIPADVSLPEVVRGSHMGHPVNATGTQPALLRQQQTNVALWPLSSQGTRSFYHLQQRVRLPAQAARCAMLPYQVTNREFQDFLEAEPFWQRGDQCRAQGKVDDYYLAHWTEADPDYPVVNVSWYAAQAYASWLGRRLHQLLRLPRQQEWELAARCGRSELDWWLEEVEQGRVNCARREGQITWVGAFPENPYGLYSILGNVYELCALPDGTIAGCGGAFHSAPAELVIPIALEPDECREDTGFRFVQEWGEEHV